MELPRITFETLILSFSSSALIALGEVDDPISKLRHIDIEIAKQNIDILDLLQEKTQGNLSDTEKSLLSSMLYDLRIKFATVCEQSTP